MRPALAKMRKYGREVQNDQSRVMSGQTGKKRPK